MFQIPLVRSYSIFMFWWHFKIPNRKSWTSTPRLTPPRWRLISPTECVMLWRCCSVWPRMWRHGNRRIYYTSVFLYYTRQIWVCTKSGKSIDVKTVLFEVIWIWSVKAWCQEMVHSCNKTTTCLPKWVVCLSAHTFFPPVRRSWRPTSPCSCTPFFTPPVKRDPLSIFASRASESLVLYIKLT